MDCDDGGAKGGTSFDLLPGISLVFVLQSCVWLISEVLKKSGSRGECYAGAGR